MATADEGIDLRPFLSQVRDQGERGTCLAFAATGCHEIERESGIKVTAHLSEEFLYWSARQYSNLVSGISFSSVSIALPSKGQPADHLWPYDGSRDETVSYAPPVDALNPAHCFCASLDLLTIDIDAFKDSLQNNRPIVLGVRMSDPFFTPMNGQIAIPSPSSVIPDNHAVLVVGYCGPGRLQDHLIVRNSWGEGWGDNGYGYLPYTYATQLGIFAGSVNPVL